MQNIEYCFGSVKVYCSYFYQLQAVLMIYVGYSYAVIDVKLAERSQTDNQWVPNLE